MNETADATAVPRQITGQMHNGGFKSRVSLCSVRVNLKSLFFGESVLPSRLATNNWHHLSVVLLRDESGNAGKNYTFINSLGLIFLTGDRADRLELFHLSVNVT